MAIFFSSKKSLSIILLSPLPVLRIYHTRVQWQFFGLKNQADVSGHLFTDKWTGEPCNKMSDYFNVMSAFSSLAFEAERVLGCVLFWSWYSSYLMSKGKGSLTNPQGEPALRELRQRGNGFMEEKYLILFWLHLWVEKNLLLLDCILQICIWITFYTVDWSNIFGS